MSPDSTCLAGAGMTSRSETKAVIEQWLAGELNPEAVWKWALTEKEKTNEVGAIKDRLVRDVLDVLAGLPYELIIEEDAEVMDYCLGNPVDEADLGQNLLWNHLDNVDTDGRRHSLSDDPFYGPFTGGIE
jgi:hypothetical protein